MTAAESEPTNFVSSLSTSSIETEILGLAGQLAAATCRMLLLIGEFNRREGWTADGIRSCAHWLTWQCGFTLGTAREHVRVAKCLASLPLVTEQFTKGELSFAKVRAITRVATPANEELLVKFALAATAPQLERIVSAIDVLVQNDDPEVA